MSEATRAIALGEAVKIVLAGKLPTAETVIAVAESFHTFITSDARGPGVASAPTAEPAPRTTAGQDAKPAGTAKPAALPRSSSPAPKTNSGKSPEDKAADAVLNENTADQKKAVSKAISGLIASNLREEAIALLGKHGAVSVSALKVENYAEVIADAEALLAAA